MKSQVNIIGDTMTVTVMEDDRELILSAEFKAVDNQWEFDNLIGRNLDAEPSEDTIRVT